VLFDKVLRQTRPIRDKIILSRGLVFQSSVGPLGIGCTSNGNRQMREILSGSELFLEVYSIVEGLLIKFVLYRRREDSLSIFNCEDVWNLGSQLGEFFALR